MLPIEPRSPGALALWRSTNSSSGASRSKQSCPTLPMTSTNRPPRTFCFGLCLSTDEAAARHPHQRSIFVPLQFRGRMSLRSGAGNWVCFVNRAALVAQPLVLATSSTRSASVVTSWFLFSQGASRPSRQRVFILQGTGARAWDGSFATRYQ